MSSDQDQKISNDSRLTATIMLSDSVTLRNEKFSRALTSYLEDNSDHPAKYYCLFITQYRDTVIADVSPLRVELGARNVSPFGVILMDNKVIFLTSCAASIFGNKMTSHVQKMYDQAIDYLIDSNAKVSGRSVLFKIPLYQDTVIVSRDLDLLNRYFMPEIHEDTLYNLPPDQ